jgi:anaerobic magnesium-protoporphyrin IX monomethyl ester cyclase
VADILLTHGYFLREDPHELEVMRPYPPLGILYISAHLKARGFRPTIFDSTFSEPAAFEALVARERPPVVGIYCNMMTRRQALRMIPPCRAAGASVVVGGPDPAGYASEYLAAGADVVVLGEGEEALEELIPALAGGDREALQGIAGIVFQGRDGNEVRTSPRPFLRDLDAQPFPDRPAIDIPAYVRVWREHHGMGSVSLITARGCPYTCTWCSHSVFGFTHRRRSTTNVADELEQIVADYRPDMVWYADDVFTIHHRWLRTYAEELERRGLRVPFETISREDRLNEDVVKTLAAMGCFRLWIGSESGSQRVLDAMQRRTDAERVREMVHLLQRHGIEAGMFIMLGYDGEEMADLEATVEHLKLAGPDRLLTTVAYPIKGTPYYEAVADRITALRPWADGSDRDLTVLGRHSRRFYRHATRWMVNELASHRLSRHGPRAYGPRLKTSVNARVGRMGMLLTRHEVERGAP